MFELMICSLVTILPDYLYRRYVQNKRFGKEITILEEYLPPIKKRLIWAK